MSALLMAAAALLLVCLGGGAGAATRWAAAELGPPLVARRFPEVDPERTRAWTTVVVNVAACFLLGIVVTLLGSSADTLRLVYLLLATGFCGGLSTLSTAALDIVELVRRGAAAIALGYLSLTIGLSMGALWLGVVIAS